MPQRKLHPNDKAARGGPTIASTGNAPGAAILAVVWAAIAGYLILFYATPLVGDTAPTQDVLRRVAVLIAAIYPDELIGHWLEDASWHALSQRAAIVLAAAAVFAVACAAGWLCLQRFKLDRGLTRLETFLFSAGAGLNLVSLFALALGLCGVMSPVVYGATAAVILAAAGATRWHIRNGADRSPSEPVESSPVDNSELPGATFDLDRRWLWLAVPFAVAILFGAMMPPADFDVREYHLQAPKEFYQQGQIRFLPHNVYANMPLGTEMLSLTGMIVYRDWWTGALVGKTLIALFAPLTALLLFAAGRRFITPAAGIVAALAYISIPWVALVSMQGLVEGAFAFYLLAALYGVMLWQRRAPNERRGNRVLWLAGFMAGGAVSTKYPAVLFCVAPLAAWILIASFETHRARDPARAALSTRLAPLCTFLLFVVVGCGLWFAKSAVLAGNPVYPLLYDAFGGRTRTVEKNEQWVDAHDPPFFRVADLARQAFHVTLWSPWLSPLVMPLAALGLLMSRRRLAWWLAAYFGYVFVTWWLFTHRIDRFWIPMLPVVALIAGIGATWTTSRGWRVPFVGLLLFTLVSNFVTITSGVFGDVRYLADLNVLRVDPRRVDPWHLYLNAHADEVTGVLLVGDAQPFDLEVPLAYNTVFDDSIFELLARDRTPEQLRDALADRDISHIYVNWREVARYRSPGNYGITRFLEPGIFDRLVDAGVLARVPPTEDDPNELYRVMPASPERADDGNTH